MGTVAFAWELGANFGHLMRQLGPAMELRRQGHDVIFIVCDVTVASQLLTPYGFPFLQTPGIPRGIRRVRRPTLNYSSLLATYGYGEPGLLRALLQAWMHTLRRINPDVVVIDHSPTALLAARALSMPAVQLGCGFFIPPDHDPLPTVQPWHPVSAAELAKIDAEVLQSINAELRALGCRELRRIGELFADSTALLTTFAELDHYPARTNGVYVGPLTAQTHYPTTQWSSGGERRIFAYLRASMGGIEPLLNVLSSYRAQVKCVIPDAPAAMRSRLARSRIELHTEPVDMNDTLEGCDLMLAYGGTGTVIQTLLKRVPLLLLPQEVEQGLVARRAAHLGVALVANNHSEQALRAWIDRLLDDPAFALAATQFAARHAGYDSVAASGEVASIIMSAAAGSAPQSVSS